MIHYTLLPEQEIKRLKREYRMRLFIFLLFFLSCAVFAGIASLAPSYMYSYTEEKRTLDKISALQKSRENSGTESIFKELKHSNEMIKKIQSHKDSVAFSNVISQILTHKPSGLTVNSFEIASTENGTSSTALAIIQGKSSTREILIQFKNALEKDPLIMGVELPVSDLAKSRGISYSIKVSLIPTL